MAAFRFGFRFLATLTLFAGLAKAGIAKEGDVTVPQILAWEVRQANVDVSVPTKAEIATCTIELETTGKTADGKATTAWVVKDAQGRILRKFHDTVGTGRINLFAYYKDGEEAYREMDTNANGKPDQYRWLGPNGSKWGIDSDEDGKIDSWVAISPEEVSQEVLAAVIAKDAKRLSALMITDAELQAMGLSPADNARIQGKMAASVAQFAKTCKELAALTDKTIWVHLDTKLPQTVPADSLKAKMDLVRYRHATILYQESDAKEAKHGWIQTGELIQVGRAWRIIQGPTPGMQPPPDEGQIVDGVAGPVPIPEGGRPFIELIDKMDKDGPGPGREGIITFNLKRAELLEKIAALYTKAEDRGKRDIWLKQVAENLATAAQQGDKTATDRLAQWKAFLAKDPASTALPYVTFREMSAQYGLELAKVGPKPEDLNKFQEAWKAKLAKFVTDFPNADDTPDATHQLGMVNEFFGAKGEEDAKAAYASLVKNFPKHSLAKRAQGCIDRLMLDGKDLDLSGPTLGTGALFNVQALKGKTVVVYYWASWNEAAAADFNKIKSAMKGCGAPVELVGVNLDSKSTDAANFIKTNQVEGTHIHVSGGQESPLAVRYGITALPVMFLVGPDGKVVNRQAQASTLDDELRKIFKAPEKDK
jgi:hypothetical protein